MLRIIQNAIRNFTSGRPFGISFIMLHHVAGNLTVAQIANVLRARGVSYHYAIARGVIAQFVNILNRAWHAGDGIGNRSIGNDRSISIAMANSGGAPNWPVRDIDFELCVELVTREARGQGWRSVTNRILPGGVITHGDVRATACPGPDVRRRIPELIRRVNANLATTAPPAPRPPAPPAPNRYFPIPARPHNFNGSIVAALNRINANSTIANRARIAVANGIVRRTQDFRGTANQNTRMLNLLMQGRLRRP